MASETIDNDDKDTTSIAYTYVAHVTKIDIEIEWNIPAHNFMGKEDATHFGIFILTFVDDRLKQRIEKNG